MTCLNCSSKSLLSFNEYSSLKRITSDVKNFKSGGEILLCENCNLVHKKVNKKLLNEINKIYSNYSPYHFADGLEQHVLLSDNQFIPRSQFIYDQIKKIYGIENINNLIDIGCGNGVTLNIFNNCGIDLYGYEYSFNNFESLKKINDFKKLYTSDIHSINKKFDLILLIHTLEHFTDPLSELKKIKKLMHENSILMIQVVDFHLNEYDILIADHISHFSKMSLFNLCKKANFNIKMITNDIKKEITLIASLNSSDRFKPTQELNSNIRLNSIINKFINDSNFYKNLNNEKIAIFGTSISSFWAYSQLQNKIDFFLDEDQNKIGKKINDIEIIHPRDYKNKKVKVLLPLAKNIKEIIINKYPNINFYSYE